uniref:Sigma-fimbriae tip adhesin n=1 Tax=Ralstonia solanacearum TaxID=305 RepID=A0A0S4VIS7_RALSL|nr:Sigma-fimbriae tip adhesin [Ralstonia solanacearum]CUV34395.1 Sigma-fimbriae tip adhesin [Ralstonia solanacearum]CUV39681.1 Sigma-fimbriae tip adhesin [Ralstonia solanacearum]CUV60066.1 Sigma-fimbriae tip adhesin [Ralstonia solanacearum]
MGGGALTRFSPWRRPVACVLVLLAQMPPGASAQSCSVASASLNFGSISPVQAGNTDTSTTLTVSCSGFLLQGTVARACLNLGVGSGDTGISPRVLSAGANQLQYNLYADSARSVVWGGRTTPATPAIQVDVSLGLLGFGSATVTVYGRVPGGQTTVPAGAYTQSFSGTAATVYALPNPGSTTCSSITSNPTTFSLSTSATLVSDCLIGATNLDFGTAGLLTSALTASSAITLNCTNQTPWTLALSAGSGSGATVSGRLLTRGGDTQTVGYNLYTSSAYTTAWGDGTGGSSTVAGTGTGLAQSTTVFGRVPAQTTPRAGTYTDTIIVTVTY